jgi:putative ABC transport system permease protein
VSLDDWLLHILPADIYVGTASGGATAGLPAEQAALAALPGVDHADFLRTAACRWRLQGRKSR